MQRKILVLGSSHTAAIAKATAGMEDFRTVWVKNPKRPDVNGEMTVDQAIETAATLNPIDVVAVTWLGTYHNIFGLIQHEQPFDFFEPGASDVDETRQIIPYSVLRAQFTKSIVNEKFIRRIAKETKANVVLLSTPPVKGDNEFIRSRMANYRGQNIREAVVTPAPIRAKLWRLEIACILDHCTALGIGFVPAPNHSLTCGDFLLPQLYGHDATHANTRYGALVAEQLIHLKHMKSIQSA